MTSFLNPYQCDFDPGSPSFGEDPQTITVTGGLRYLIYPLQQVRGDVSSLISRKLTSPFVLYFLFSPQNTLTDVISQI